MKKISLILILIMLSGCSTDGILKKSANNKLIDTKGFHGAKRRPLYNKKYIDKAKLNISRGDFEEEEYDDEEQYLENLPPSLKNRYIYEDMIEDDIKAERARRAKKKSFYLKHLRDNRDEYPDLGRGRDNIRSNSENIDNQELKQELKEIRSLLDSAREDLVKYRCPMDESSKGALPVRHEVKPRKIHEQVKSEDRARAVAPKASLPKAIKTQPKPYNSGQMPASKPAQAPLKPVNTEGSDYGRDNINPPQKGQDANAYNPQEQPDIQESASAEVVSVPQVRQEEHNSNVVNKLIENKPTP